MHNKQYKIRKKKRFVTLIEMMIVMFLIALITGVVAYNYSGTLDKGKAFKTETGMERIHSILSLSLAENPQEDLSEGQWQNVIRRSPLVKNADALLQDGWGGSYTLSYDPTTQQLMITSERYNRYRSTHSK